MAPISPSLSSTRRSSSTLPVLLFPTFPSPMVSFMSLMRSSTQRTPPQLQTQRRPPAEPTSLQPAQFQALLSPAVSQFHPPASPRVTRQLLAQAVAAAAAAVVQLPQ